MLKQFALLSILSSLFFGCKNEASIRYVDNARLFREVKSISVIQDSLKTFNESWQKPAHDLKDSVDAYMKRLGATKKPLSDAERAKVEKEFKDRQEAFQKFVEANQKKAAEIDKNLSESAIKKVNAVLQDYRAQKGYAVILGTTTGGNILAADQKLDITDEVIQYVNAHIE